MNYLVNKAPSRKYISDISKIVLPFSNEYLSESEKLVRPLGWITQWKIQKKADRFLKSFQKKDPSIIAVYNFSWRNSNRYLIVLSKEGWQEEAKKQKENENEIVDFLGTYCSEQPNSKEPSRITLYVNRIWESSGLKDKTIYTDRSDAYKYLFTKVFIHEFMHMMMDVRNYGLTEKVQYSDEYGRWREEAFANAMTLNILEKDPIYYKYAKAFIKENQVGKYQLGLVYEKIGSCDEKLRQRLTEKIVGVDDRVQKKWLRIVKKIDSADFANDSLTLNQQIQLTQLEQLEGKMYLFN